MALTSKSTNKAGAETFTVTGVTPPADARYDAAQNVESSVSVTIAK